MAQALLCPLCALLVVYAYRGMIKLTHKLEIILLCLVYGLLIWAISKLLLFVFKK